MIRALLLCVLLSGCDYALSARVSTLAPVDPADYPDAPAVVLLHAVELALDDDGNSSHADLRIHRVVQVLTREGLDEGDVKFPIYRGQTVRDFKARTITADGQIIDLPRSRTFLVKSSAGDGEQTPTSLNFAFPRVGVGSILEYSVVVRTEWHPHAWRRPVGWGRLPVKTERFRVSGTGRVQPAIDIYNHPVKLEGGLDGRRWWAGATFRDLAPAEDEALQDHWSWRRPYWIYRMTHRQWGRTPTPVLDNWDAAGAYTAKRIFITWGDLPQTGFSPTCAAGAGRVDCVIAAAWDHLQARIETTGLGSLRGKPLKAVDAARVGKASQRAAYLWRLLQAADVKALPAVISRTNRARLDWRKPYPDWLDHLLVYVPKQPGVAAPIWLDPECTWCAPGQLPWFSYGAQALVLDYATLGETLSGKRTTVKGPKAGARRVASHFDGSLSQDGTLRGRWTVDTAGAAIGLHRRRGGAARIRRRRDRWVRAVHQNAEMGLFSERCDRAARTCTSTGTLRAEGYAARQGRQLVVPLTAFARNGWLRAFAAPERKTHVRINGDRRLHDRFELALPAGARLRSAPAPIAVKSPLGEMAFEVTTQGDRVIVERRLFARGKRMAPTDWRTLRAPFDFYRRLRDASLIIELPAPVAQAGDTPR